MKITRHILCAALAVLLAWLATGCAPILAGGQPVNPMATRSLVAGMTYAEVTAELGPPVVFVDGPRVIAYPWYTNRGYRSLTLWHSDDEYWVQENAPQYHALCLRFDAAQRLQTWTNLVANGVESRRQAMQSWAATPRP